MARATRCTQLETRSARGKLQPNHEPYWVGIGRGLYLGYRKGAGGTWIARYYFAQKYHKRKLAKADDFQDANNIDVLNYFQAQAKAREFADSKIKGTVEINFNNFTVADAVNNYLSWMKSHRKSYSTTIQVAKAHILPSLGSGLVSHLSTKKLREWHEALIKNPPRAKGSPIKQDYAKMLNDPEVIRRRKATANRILTILKAALNYVWRDGLVPSDEAWRKVKPFHNVDIPKIRYLELVECQRLINACDPDFRKLVHAALLTGCRYGELTKLKVDDFDSTNKSIFIRETKNGKPRYIPLTEEGVVFFDSITFGVQRGNLIFMRNDGAEWSASHQSRRLKDACKKVGIEPTISFHILRHTYGSLLASRGVPLQVIAELLGHSDTRVTSKHYAHLMPSFVANTLRENLPQFVADEAYKIKKLKKVRVSYS